MSLDGEATAAAPGAPTEVTASADDGEATISWTAPASNGGSPVTAYTVTSSHGDTWETSGTSLTVTGLTNGIGYTFTVQARNWVGAGPWSLPSAVVVPLGVPDSPGSLLAIPGNRTVALSWAAPADDGGTPITGYTVRAYTYIDSVEDWVVVATQSVSEAVTTAAITGLANGTEYVFEVTASNAVGEGWEAYAVSVPSTVPDAVTGVVAVAGDRQVTVSWSAPQSDGGSPITGYTVTSSSGGSWATSNTSLIVTGLVNGQEYSFTVAAKNAAGAGPTSQASPRVTPQPPAPQQIAPQPPAPQQTAPQPTASVKVKATSKQSKLFVDVNPNKGSGHWKFQVQRLRTDGSWQFVKAYRTKGSKETRTINLPKGTYRVVVTPKYGYAEGTSAAVYLRR